MSKIDQLSESRHGSEVSQTLSGIKSQEVNFKLPDPIESTTLLDDSIESSPRCSKPDSYTIDPLYEDEEDHSSNIYTQFFRQCGILMWKNLVLHQRKMSVTLLEILVPSLFAIVLVAMQAYLKNEHNEAIVYKIQSNMAFKYMEMNLTIGFFPETKATYNVIQRMVAIHYNSTNGGCDETINLMSRSTCHYRAFSVEGEAVEYFKAHYKQMTYIIDFGNLTAGGERIPNKPTIIIRPYRQMNQIWQTEDVYPFDKPQIPPNDSMNYGFTYVQTLLNLAVMAHWDNLPLKETHDIALNYLRYPYPEHIVDNMYETIRMQLTLFEVLAYLMIAFVFTKNIVHEKEMKLKESMKLMGMGLPAYWLSWFLICLLTIMPTIAAFTICLTVDFTSLGPLLRNVEPSVIFVQLLCYSISLISFSFLMSSLVQNASDGMILSGMVFLIIYVPFEVLSLNYSDLSYGGKLSACTLLNVGLGFCNFNIARRSYNGLGLKWSNIDEPIDEGDISLAEIFGIFLSGSVLKCLLVWYLDNVYPGKYGVPRPWNFFLMRSYWCGYYHKKQVNKSKSIFGNYSEPESRFFERKRSNKPVGIELRRLTKRFGDLISVNNLSLKIYEGEITVLLGHNGAGKTTTMSMMTGFIPPTSGVAIVHGYNINNEIAQIHKILGLCPQHDILFDTLTAYEHLWFYSKLKGYKSNNLRGEIIDMLDDVGFGSNYHQRVCNMSGGQKRSLSVGIALMGDSKVVILDEPSSGMDPSTRRNTWDILMKHRRRRTMVLSTHYMDEADTLGDRIAIMAKGEIQCCGSSMFLKKAYGAGIRLLIEAKENMDLFELQDVMREFVPQFKLNQTNGSNICFLLPESSAAIFPALFRHLSKHKEELGIENFGTRTTTMEEVFLLSEKMKSRISSSESLANIPTKQSESKASKYCMDKMSVLLKETAENSHRGLTLAIYRIKAQLIKRYIVSRRNLISTGATFVLPPIFYLFFLFINQAMVKSTEIKKTTLMFDIDMYSDTKVLVGYTKDTPQLKNVISNILKDKTGTHELIIVQTVDDLTKFILDKYKNEDGYSIDRTYLVGAQFYKNGNTSGINILYNGNAYHTMFVSNQLALNTFIRKTFNASYTIKTGVFPLPMKGETELLVEYEKNFKSGFFVGLLLGIGFCIYTGLTVHYLLRERLSGVKHMHAMFGVGMLTYWIPTFIWDLIGFGPPICVLFIIFDIFDIEEFLVNWMLILFVFLLYAWASLPVNYAMQFGFPSASSGLVGIIIINMFGVLLSNIVVNEFSKPQSTNKNVAWILDFVFAATIPSYDLSQCFTFILLNYKTNEMCKPYQDNCRRGIKSLCCANNAAICKSEFLEGDCFSWHSEVFGLGKSEGIGHYCFIMIGQGCVGFLILFLLEVGPARLACDSLESEDVSGEQDSTERVSGEEEMVEKEKLRVMHVNQCKGNSEFSIIAKGLTKRYSSKVAVDDLYFSVTKGQCLGLLGQSGAGKTTLFRMLTGQTAVTSGNAYLDGYSVRSDLRTVQKFIGYCPQYDAHIPEMNAYETLTFYSMLRGVKSKAIYSLINSLIAWVMIDDCALNKSGNYSGGNRRKLSLAMALVGDPKFIFLDEPSSGMDPKARRQMWNVLTEILATGRTMILTSHSMDECEALSTNLAIMMRGRLLCYGTPQHLKIKYGQGYTIIIKEGLRFEDEVNAGNTILNFLKERVPDIKLFDEHPGYLHLQIPHQDSDIGDVFAVMEECKATLNIEDYSVNETTLEQVFLTFIKSNALKDTQEEEDLSCWNMQAGFFDDRFWKCSKAKRRPSVSR